MSDPFFFGYGSLVNRTTHGYQPARRAEVKGWRRAWKHTGGRDVPYLTAVRDPGTTIQGLIAPVPGADWLALDEREHGYARHALGEAITVLEGDHTDAQIYAVPPHTMVPPPDRPVILMSYLDVVVQGYLTEFGEAGAQAFFDTTDGWDIPVLNDRHAPLYPRHRRLSAEQTAFVNDSLSALRARVVTE